MNEQGGLPEPVYGKPQQDRRLFGLLGLFGVAALFFGFFQVMNIIRGPFRLPQQTQEQQLGPTGAAISALSKKDTDKDGLSDFEELYQLQTSPYLADSDSDGNSDQSEVFAGTDPNCPQGETCTPIISSSNTNATVNTNGGVAAGVNGSLDGLSLADLRVALRNAGAPAATLDGLSDEELLQLYQEVTGETGLPTLSNTTNSVTGNSNAPATNSLGNLNLNADLDRSTLENLSPDQIREFLRRGGADEQLLLEVDDETLRSIFEDSLNDLSAS